MDSLNFVYWLNGYFDLSAPNQGLTPEQVQVIKNHLALVLKQVVEPVKLPTNPVGMPPSVPSSPFDLEWKLPTEIICSAGESASLVQKC